MRRKSKLQRLDAYVKPEVGEQIKQVAKRKGMSVSEYLGWVGERDSRDEQQEYEANQRRIVEDTKQREDFEASIAAIPAGRPRPPKPSEAPDLNSGEAMSFDEYRALEARVLALHREHLSKLDACQHPTVSPGESCPKCLRVKPAGSGKIVRNKPAFKFHVPSGRGLA